jgi:hypothetical protein
VAEESYKLFNIDIFVPNGQKIVKNFAQFPYFCFAKAFEKEGEGGQIQMCFNR